MTAEPREAAAGSATVATVLDARGLGPHDRVLLQLENGAELLAHFPPETAPAPGSKLRIGLRSAKPHFVADA